MPPRICLNMIVKNETAIIERCLASVAPHIACYVIADTGSTDGTQELIRRFFDARGIPGEIVEFPFVNFEQARNRALDAAKASSMAFEYILMADADMELFVEGGPLADKLSHRGYEVMQYTTGELEYPNVRLMRRDAPFRYAGVTHEVLLSDGEDLPVLGGVHYFDHACGANRVTKYERDISLLTEALQKDPQNTRYVFYLANSYFDSDRFEEALAWYRRRSEIGVWKEEVFVSLYRMAWCLQMLGREAEFFHQAMLTFEQFPHRAEPLYRVAHHCMNTGRHRLGYHFASIGALIPKPPPLSLFVESSVYAWRLIDIMAVCSFYIGRLAEGAELNQRLLQIAPAGQHDRIRANLDMFRGAR